MHFDTYEVLTLCLDSQVMANQIVNSLLPGCTVYMTGFCCLEEMFVRKLEDHNNEFEHFLDQVKDFCSSGK